ncbi:MAG: hypothetical protein KIT31_17240 [Deltaproteobacteria bacterium]|nr:hypothetical protein [Deltaproteobacteria bacterium]
MDSNSVTEYTDSAIIGNLKAAARRAHESLRGIGQRAFYSYPDDAGRFDGFSYTIPKEEQIRSEFYRHLDAADGVRYELEWNTYERRQVRGRVRIVRAGEIDLVGFQSNAVVAALEVKRIWSLDGWYAKAPEHLRAIESDIDKLRPLLTELARRESGVPLAGVIVARFADSAERMQVLGGALASRFRNVLSLHAEDLHVCEEPPRSLTP